MMQVGNMELNSQYPQRSDKAWNNYFTRRKKGTSIAASIFEVYSLSRLLRHPEACQKISKTIWETLCSKSEWSNQTAILSWIFLSSRRQEVENWSQYWRMMRSLDKMSFWICWQYDPGSRNEVWRPSRIQYNLLIYRYTDINSQCITI